MRWFAGRASEKNGRGVGDDAFRRFFLGCGRLLEVCWLKKVILNQEFHGEVVKGNGIDFVVRKLPSAVFGDTSFIT